jgi:hypothetical protein
VQDYSYFNQQMAHIPSLSHASWKAVTMDEVYLFKNGTNKFTLPPGKQPNRQFRIQVQKFLSSTFHAVSVHYNCSALGFRALGCPSL